MSVNLFHGIDKRKKIQARRVRQWNILKTCQNTRYCNHLRFSIYCLNYLLSFSDSNENKLSLGFVFKQTAMGQQLQATRLWSCKFIFNFLHKSVIVIFSCSSIFLTILDFLQNIQHRKIIIFRTSERGKTSETYLLINISSHCSSMFCLAARIMFSFSRISSGCIIFLTGLVNNVLYFLKKLFI